MSIQDTRTVPNELNIMNEVFIYRASDDGVQVEEQFEVGWTWLSQQQMAAMFVQTRQNICLCIQNCFEDGVLLLCSVVKHSMMIAFD
jgi:hypothetical protein